MTSNSNTWFGKTLLRHIKMYMYMHRPWNMNYAMKIMILKGIM